MNEDSQELEPRTFEPPSACERVRGRLTELWDDQLSPVETARDRGHLEACGACAAEWSKLESMLRAISDSRAPGAELAWANADLDRRLGEVDIAPSGSSWSQRLASSALPIAASIAAMVLIHTVSQDRGSIENVVPDSIRVVGSWRPSIADWTRGVEHLFHTDGESQLKEG